MTITPSFEEKGGAKCVLFVEFKRCYSDLTG
jgi:hypothetical protein